jgi:hypothetical protein
VLRFKQKLFGNIMFVGELNRRGLLQESIILSVFEMLLGVETSGERNLFINDHTVEGATVLMAKIGHLIDVKLANHTEAIKAGQAKKSNIDTVEKINKVFDRFNELQGDSCDIQICNRVKMLTKNMLEDRISGWVKAKQQNDAGPMKVDDLRRKLEAKLRAEEEVRIAAEREEQAYLGYDQY